MPKPSAGGPRRGKKGSECADQSDNKLQKKIPKIFENKFYSNTRTNIMTQILERCGCTIKKYALIEFIIAGTKLPEKQWILRAQFSGNLNRWLLTLSGRRRRRRR